MAKEKVLVVGGGFAGVKAALELADDDRFQVTILSDRPDFRYYPSLYRTATGGQSDTSSIFLKNIFEEHKLTIAQGEAISLDRQAKTVTTKDGEVFNYDTLLLALGVVTNYFGIKGLREYSYGIKSVEEAERFKSHLHQQLIDTQMPDLNYVIVGAGPTGIELAGALGHYLKCLMTCHGVKHRAIHIDLIEAAPRLLPRLPKDTARVVKRRLKHLGVRLYLGQAVQGETADELMVSGKPIRSHTVIWTAGVTNQPFFKDNAFALTNRGKVSTDVYLQAEDNIFVLGDNANTPYSGMAQTALNDGKFVAGNLKRRTSGKNFKSYSAKQPITVIPVGQKWAAVVWGKLRIYGWLGWVLRELADLIAFHDYEPWPKATHQWLTEFDTQENCLVCATQKNSF
ncbi:MAG TPA: FAD-dependent oxidoreductase [Candidatus Saccharimonadales bacterium]|nr:FAD-dependent oxidoreductase [Candidatus Saccharimonadales bacterium]